MKVNVYVTLKPGVLDPQGKAIHHALEGLGFGGVASAASGIAKILFVIFLVLFLISLSSHGGGATFWIKVVFSGGFAAASSVGTILLWRRVQQQKKTDAAHGSTE